MNIVAVDDEKLALELLVDSIEKVVPEAKVKRFSENRRRAFLCGRERLRRCFS